ncbi:MAG: hydrogenase 2 operon protein HybA [Proteobacteria bacterium]|nr:hydrogenase 2 operon protein HybA [Pseudomonadota bacterium]
MKTTNRRQFFKRMALAGVGVMAAPLLSAKSAVAMKLRPRHDEDVGMLYDATKCIGCRSCEVACKKANGMPFEYDPQGIWDAPIDLSDKTLTIVKLYTGDQEQSFIKRQCMHCVDPACVSGCPTSALIKQDNGVVTWNIDACVGCRYCQMGCPFNIPKYEFDAQYGRIRKCEMCANNGLLDKGQTACSNACPTGAIAFGIQQDLIKTAKSRIRKNPGTYFQDKIYGELDSGGTGVLYMAGVPFDKLGLPDLPEYSSARISEGIQHTIYQNMVAPIVIYIGLAIAAFRNIRKSHKKTEE